MNIESSELKDQETGRDLCKKIGWIFLTALLFIIIKDVGNLIPFLQYDPVSTKQLDELKLDNFDSLMIVAHPDDEVLWGGAHLLEGKYFVVCITNGYNTVRKREFMYALEQTGDRELILNYADKVGSVKSGWYYCQDEIQQDLETILNYKKWKTVVTHNKYGEYGHIHHIMTHKLVVKAYEQTRQEGEFLFFGRYYRKKQLQELAEEPEGRISDDLLEQKNKILEGYESQMHTVLKLSHMNPYENWQEANENTK